MTSLLCDLGGTNCRLAIATPQSEMPGEIKSYANEEFASFADLVDAYLTEIGVVQLQMMVIALAAPIEGDSVRLTNRDWLLDKAELSARFSVDTIAFLNDFEALGHAMAISDRLEQAVIVQPQTIVKDAPKLVLGAGTGFNCALLSGRKEVICAEAGHSSLVTETALDRQLQDMFIQRYGRCSTERVLSGGGMIELYNVICTREGISPIFASSHNIVEAGCSGNDPIAAQSCAEFARILGRLVGDLALLMLPYSGIFLTGGITRALEPVLRQPDGPFLRAFNHKGRMADHMKRFAIHVLQDDHVALFGCLAYYGSFIRDEA